MATVTHKRVAVGEDNPHAEVNKGEWNDNHDVLVDFEDMGVYVGTVAPTFISRAQWKATRVGYWGFIDISSEPVYVVIATAAVNPANAVGSINPLTADFTRYVTAVINPANAVGSIAALVATVTASGAVSAEVMPANATGMVYALTAAYTRYIVATVNPALATGIINKLVASYARYVTAAAGTANAAGSINALVATVSGGGGTKTSINGISSLSTGVSADTGTESGVSMSGAAIHIAASITSLAPEGPVTTAALYVDGVLRDSITAEGTEFDDATVSRDLVYTPSAGAHSIRVVADGGGGGLWLCNNFRIPQ